MPLLRSNSASLHVRMLVRCMITCSEAELDLRRGIMRVNKLIQAVEIIEKDGRSLWISP